MNYENNCHINRITIYKRAVFGKTTYHPEGISVGLECAAETRRGQTGRASINDFSRRSAKRLCDRFLCIDPDLIHDKHGALLTYPNQDETWEALCVKADLKNLYKRLNRVFPDLSFLWKLEFMQSKIPHFHIVIINSTTDTDYLHSVLFHSWLSVLKNSYGITRREQDNFKKFNNHMEPNGQYSNLQVIRSDYGIQSYFSGYLRKCKDYQNKTPEGFGSTRYWGILGRKNWPHYEPEVKEIGDQEFSLLKEITKHRYRSQTTFSWHLDVYNPALEIGEEEWLGKEDLAATEGVSADSPVDQAVRPPTGLSGNGNVLL